MIIDYSMSGKNKSVTNKKCCSRKNLNSFWSRSQQLLVTPEENNRFYVTRPITLIFLQL